MSRYSKSLGKGKDVAYGFDHVTGYFFQVFDTDKDGEDVAVINECSMFTKMSKGRMVELMKEHGVSESHIANVSLDLPI